MKIISVGYFSYSGRGGGGSKKLHAYISLCKKRSPKSVLSYHISSLTPATQTSKGILCSEASL